MNLYGYKKEVEMVKEIRGYDVVERERVVIYGEFGDDTSTE